MYVLTITDGNGCRVFGTDSIPVTQPAPITATNVMTPVSCFGGNDGAILVTPAGGTAPYTNSWSNGNTTNNPTALTAGNYSDTIKDVNGCTYIDANIAVTQPTAVSIALNSVTLVSCAGLSDGAISITPSGGTPGYTYAWTPSGSTNPLTNLTAGSYTVTVSDTHNCTDTLTVVVGTEPPMVLTASKKNILCPPLHDGAVVLNVTGGTPTYQYHWSNGATTSQIYNLNIGTDLVTVTDSRGCTIDTSFVISNDSSFKVNPVPDTATINEGDAIQLGLDITTAPGDQAHTIAWVPAYSLSCNNCAGPLATPLNTTEYSIHLVSDSGCTADTKILITVIPQHQLYVPNAFTPNGSGINDFWEIFGNRKVWKFVEVQVYDRWGEKVFESNDIHFQWDGRYRGTMMEPGEYVYVLKLTFIDGYTVSNKGSIALIR
jgi:gliding motility-associated-like protein